MKIQTLIYTFILAKQLANAPDGTQQQLEVETILLEIPASHSAEEEIQWAEDIAKKIGVNPRLVLDQDSVIKTPQKLPEETKDLLRIARRVQPDAQRPVW